MMKTLNAPRLAQNAPFAHLGSPRRCQSVVIPVHMAKTRHSGRMFGRKMGRKWAENGRNVGHKTKMTQTGNYDEISKRTQAGPKGPFCSSRRSQG